MKINVSHISKSFESPDALKTNRVQVLSDISFEIASGQSLALFGPSGSGKSTLLSLIAGFDSPDSGRIQIGDTEISSLNEGDRTQFRLENLSMVFQDYHLIPYLTALENVMLPLQLRGESQKSAEEKAHHLLKLIGLTHRTNHFGHQLSGGENQRVAFARAFVTQPKVILADEPSGSLDHENGKKVIDLLYQLCNENKSTLVLVTHSLEIAERSHRVFHFTKKQ